MKKFLDRYKKKIIVSLLWTIVVVFFAVIIPIAINYAFSRPALCPLFAVDWEAKDALAFYGSILGAGATIFVLRQTIVFTRENQKEERKLAVKPYLQTKIQHIEGLTSELEQKELIFVELKKDIIESPSALPDELNDLFIIMNRMSQHPSAALNGYSISFAKKSTAYFKSHYLLMYEIKNCGAGNAISVKFKMNGFKSYPAFCITTNEPNRQQFKSITTGKLERR